MKIRFMDGKEEKGFREETVARKQIVNSILVVEMADGARFRFPLINVREIKDDPGSWSKDDE